MSQGKRLLAFLLLNIIVSAATTYAVLTWWSQAHPTPALPTLSAQGTLLPTEPVQPADQGNPPVNTIAAPIPLDQVVIAIDNVFGVGNLQDEYVLLKRTGEGELSLTNWVLDDGSGNVYTFPDLTLLANATVQVHTGIGSDSAVDLYWGKDAAVWKEGKIVSLLDDKGRLRATYMIP